jgi:hypothetical protein
MNFYTPDLDATFAQGIDDDSFASNSDNLPRFVFLMMRLFAFGYTDWVQAPNCPLPDFAKDCVRRLDDAAFCTKNVTMVIVTVRALFMHYPPYQRWLCDLPATHPLAQKAEYAKHRFLSMPIDRVKGLCKTSRAQLGQNGMYSLHYMLLTTTYQEIRMNGFWTNTEAERFVPHLMALRMIPATDRAALIVPADEALEYIHDFIG